MNQGSTPDLCGPSAWPKEMSSNSSDSKFPNSRSPSHVESQFPHIIPSTDRPLFHRCKRSALVDRSEYGAAKTVTCPLPRCGYAWCKKCNQPVACIGTAHVCDDGTTKLQALMDTQGWMYCPGNLFDEEYLPGTDQVAIQGAILPPRRSQAVTL